MKKLILSLSLWALTSGTAHAGWISFGTETFAGGNSGTVIPDPESGNPVAVVSNSLTVSGINPATFTGADVRVRIYGLYHPWAGDLVVMVRHVASGITATLFSQIGVPSVDAYGYAADFVTAFGGYYEFYPGAPTSLWGTAAVLGDADVIPDAIPGVPPTAVSYYPTSAGSAANNNFATLTTITNPNGEWQLIIMDMAAGPETGTGQPDLGFVTGWEIEVFNPVPEPSTVATAGLALAALAFGRRSRK